MLKIKNLIIPAFLLLPMGALASAQTVYPVVNVTGDVTVQDNVSGQVFPHFEHTTQSISKGAPTFTQDGIIFTHDNDMLVCEITVKVDANNKVTAKGLTTPTPWEGYYTKPDGTVVQADVSCKVTGYGSDNQTPQYVLMINPGQ